MVLTLATQADLVKEDKGKKATFLKALITLPINVNQTKKVQAKFSSLNKQGITTLNNIVINGTLSYKKAGNYQKVFIKWHGVENNIKKPKAINKAEFSKKFRSELTTDEQQIGTPQEVTIEVDKKSFMQAVNKLNKGLMFTKAETLTAKTNSNTKSNRTGLNTNAGRGSFSSSNGVKSQLPKLGDAADAGGTAIEQCDYRYDIGSMMAHEQQRTNQVNSTGVVTEQGACLDTTKTFDLVKAYGAPCTPFISTDKVYQSYRITGIVEGEDKIIKSCQADLSNEIIITTTETGCNTSDNINTRVSTATSRRYYMLNGSEVEVQQCLPGTNPKTFAIQEAVCSYGVVSVNGYSIPQTKLYYINDLGVDVSVRGCQVSPTQQFTTHKIDCTGSERYEHDSASSTSYLMQKTFVVDTISGTEEQINACQRSSSSFAHQAQSCPTIHDDDNLRLLRPKRSYFNDTTLADTNTDIDTGSRIYLTSCDDGIADATPYLTTTTATATTYTRGGDNTAYGHCMIAGGSYGTDGSGCLLYGTGSVLYEAYADGLRQSASNDVTFASIPNSVLSLVDPTKRLKITAIAGGGATEGRQSDIVGGWGQRTSTYYTNPMTNIVAVVVMVVVLVAVVAIVVVLKAVIPP
ncbi:MAG: hypothetical protein Rsou_0546 [Candidatus Ruthia sp. Asou_11_S2]|nr:hypothetical protein [Candidatus Ruthia sp. Asou_11_S2]